MTNNFVQSLSQPIDQSIMTLDIRRPKGYSFGQMTCTAIAALAVVVGIWWAGHRIHQSINQTNRRGRMKPRSKPTDQEHRKSGSSGDFSKSTVQRPPSPPVASHVDTVPVAEPVKRTSSPSINPPSTNQQSTNDDKSVSNEETRKQMFYDFLQLYANVDSSNSSPDQSNPQSVHQSPPSSYKHSPSLSFDQSMLAAEPVHQHHRTMSNQSVNQSLQLNHQSPSIDPAALLATSSSEGVAKDLLKQSVGKWDRIERKRRRKQQLYDDPSTASPASSALDGFASPLSFADDISINSNDQWEEDENIQLLQEESKEGDENYQSFNQSGYFHPHQSPLQLPAAHPVQDSFTYQSIDQTVTQTVGSSPLNLPPRPGSSHGRNGRSNSQSSKQTNSRSRHARQPSSLTSTTHWHETQVTHIG